jgi:hypothetical protein
MFTKLEYITQQVSQNKSIHREGNQWTTYHEPDLWLVMADSWEVMDYLLYSPDLVPSDFCLFAGK